MSSGLGLCRELSPTRAVGSLMMTLVAPRLTRLRNRLMLVFTVQCRSIGTSPSNYLWTCEKARNTNNMFETNIVLRVAL